MKKRTYLFSLFLALLMSFSVACSPQAETAEVSQNSVKDQSKEISEVTPEATPEVTSKTKPTNKPEKNKNSDEDKDVIKAGKKEKPGVEKVAAGNAEKPVIKETESADEPDDDWMTARRAEVIAYEKARLGYSPTEEGERYLDYPCGYCGVTDVDINRYGACAICQDEYIQPEWGWCEVCGGTLNAVQSNFNRCWSCMKCQYCGTDMSGYINYDTGGVDSPDGTWTCTNCYNSNNAPSACDRCGKQFEGDGDMYQCGVYDNLPYKYICSNCYSYSCKNCGFYSEDMNALYEGRKAVCADVGLCTGCYQAIYGEPYLQPCSVCGDLIHPSGRINGMCWSCYEVENIQTEF